VLLVSANDECATAVRNQPPSPDHEPVLLKGRGLNGERGTYPAWYFPPRTVVMWLRGPDTSKGRELDMGNKTISLFVGIDIANDRWMRAFAHMVL